MRVQIAVHGGASFNSNDFRMAVSGANQRFTNS